MGKFSMYLLKMIHRNPAFRTFCLALSVASLNPVFAQTTVTPLVTESERPAIQLDATIKAKTLQFQSLPEINVNVGEWTSERKNLPETLESGKVYKNIEVHTTLTSPLRIETEPSIQDANSKERNGTQQ